MQIKYQAEIATKEPVAAVKEPEATTPENGKAGEKRKAQFPELFSASGAKKVGHHFFVIMHSLNNSK